MHKVEWRLINKAGLKRYSMNQMGDIRSESTRVAIDFRYNDKGERYVVLIYRGKERDFIVSHMIEITFPDLRNAHGGREVVRIILPAKDRRLSTNEDDYGGKGGGEWEEIRDLAKGATKTRKEDGTNIDYKVVI